MTDGAAMAGALMRQANTEITAWLTDHEATINI
jgi:hypothetical protein